MAEKTTSTTSATKYTTLVPPYDQNPTYAAKPEEDPPQEKHQFRYSFDGQDILLSYTRGVYEDWKLLWYYEGTAKTGEKVIAKVSAEKGYVKTISYEEELSGKRGPFDREEGCKMLLAKMPDVEEVQATKNFLGSGEYYGPNYKTPPPFLTASLSLTDQKINVTCYWSGALYDGTFRVTSFFVEEDRNKNPKVVEEGALDFIYPQWV